MASAVALSLLLAAASAQTPVSLYVKGESLQETLLAARANYAAWLPRQQEAAAAVTFGAWHTVDGENAAATPQFPPPAPAGLKARNSVLASPWTRQPTWRDGMVHPVTAVHTADGWATAYLFRTISAARPVSLTLGIGGGDRIELWLDGRKTHDLDTSLPYERYGTSMRLEGTRRDQRLIELSLDEGGHELVMAVRQALSAARRPPLEFHFSPNPDPVPGLWTEIRRDFPPQENRLLELVEQDWFEPGGWMTATDASFEKRFLEQILPDAGRARQAGNIPGDGPDFCGEGGENGPVPFGGDDGLLDGGISAADRRWLDLCVTAAELAQARRDLEKLRLAVAELSRGFPETYDGAACLGWLADYEKRLLARAQVGLDPSVRSDRRLLAELAGASERMLVRTNPLLGGRKLLVVKRFTYDSQHYYDDYYHGLREFGGNIFELSLDDGGERPLVPELEGGVFDRYDLSPDARRIVFGYRAPRPEGYRIWEAGIDGGGLRQLTFPPEDEPERIARHSHYPPESLEANPSLYGHWTDDLHPCYLPDGGIALVSTRPEHSVICGGHALTCTSLCRMDGDGGGLEPLSRGALSEFTPTMLGDGRILYNRWEYVYKGIAAVQPLWAMRPDGSGSEEIYGNNVANPGVFVQARQVPGHKDLIVATACGHEPLAVGAIVLLDRCKDKRSRDVMTSLTPDTDVQGLRGLYQKRNGRWREDLYGPFYCDPYPLSDKFFLVACNPDRRYNDPTAYGIYLVDAFGNRAPVYVDPEISCWQPMLLEPRPSPPVLAAASDRLAASSGEAEPEATLLVTDVYRGLDGVERGEVKYLRVMEQIPRSWTATPKQSALDNVPGQQPAVSYHTHIWIAVLLGIVPVEEDGSVRFRAPADRNLFFQALDEDFMEIQRMRTFVNFRPGESRSCIGCHEHRVEAPRSRTPLALGRPPRELQPQPGETAPRPIHYAGDVQPVLDRHCAGCHAGDESDGGLDLSGELTTHFNRSYEDLVRGGYVNFIQEWTGPRLESPPPYFTVGGSMAHVEAVPPRTYGSHQSKLIALLRQGHEGVELAPEEFIKLVTWVDANAQYYGSYFGRRNIVFRNHPEFRPVPTLASARGTPPEPLRPKPMPAELAAWWKLDEGQGDRAADSSPNGCDASLVRASWTAEGRSAAVRFDGSGHLQPESLGMMETLSVAMWVKADSLANRWNPLVFSDDAESSAFHFSVLAEGVANVAINSGGRAWVHSRAATPITPGCWQHLAVVCDPRFGGSIRFYLDGRLDAEHPLELGVPLDLDGFRLGAWNRWQSAPQNNFHGTLDDVRIWRGMLTDEQVAELAAADLVARRNPPGPPRR